MIIHKPVIKKYHRLVQSLLLTLIITTSGFGETTSAQTWQETKSGTVTLHPSSPDSAGLVVENTDAIEAKEGLVVYNFAAHEAEAAKAITIIAPQITLGKSITVLGRPADIILIATDSSANTGGFVIDSVTTSNVSGLTLVRGSAAPDNAAGADFRQQPFTIDGRDGIEIIGYIDAPSAQTLSIFAPKLTEQPSRLLPSDKGFYHLANGQLNIAIGRYLWSFGTQAAVPINPDLSSLSHASKMPLQRFAATAFARGISITQVGVHRDIDIAASAVYTNSTAGQPGQNSTSIANYGPGDMTLSGQILSQGRVEIMSSGDIYLNHYAALDAGPLTAEDFSLITQGSCYTSRNIKANARVELAANTIFNRGTITANTSIALLGERAVVNHFGGRLAASELYLESPKGSVTNGSITPVAHDILVGADYRTVSDDNRGIRSFYASEFFSSFYRVTHHPNKPELTINPRALGAFYRFSKEFHDYPAKLLMPGRIAEPFLNWMNQIEHKKRFSDVTAQIAGARVTLVAQKSFQNINPYFERVTEGHVSINRHHAHQVAVTATEELIIIAPHILNSSAQIATTTHQAKFRISSKELLNERYRIEAGFTDTTSRHTEKGPKIYDKTDTLIDAIHAPIRILAPPASIMSSGEMIVETGSFENHASYVEVLGDFTLDTRHAGADYQNLVNLRSLGYRYEAVAQEAIFTQETVTTKGQDNDGDPKLISTPKRSQAHIDTYLITAKDTDALFHVEGTVKGNGRTYFGKLSPLDHYIYETLQVYPFSGRVESQAAAIVSSYGEFLQMRSPSNDFTPLNSDTPLFQMITAWKQQSQGANIEQVKEINATYFADLIDSLKKPSREYKNNTSYPLIINMRKFISMGGWEHHLPAHDFSWWEGQ